ncbi:MULTISPECIES: TonB-dependent siderophore receptor [unclassified Achromobacter]|uniref:TonB-dependent siderophore receptor n=1 Tax=unclassified Achromobacter TaxID=2626865 RepID=UPI0013037515|nr:MULTISPECIES: TonB-dependent siderophore receptor [unclassified Achromobacter]
MAGAASLPLATASAQPAPSATAVRHDFDIPQGSLDQALSRFGRQAGTAISVNAALTAGLRSPGVRGSYSAADALARLLAGTGLQAVQDGAGEYTLRALPGTAASTGAATLPAVQVTGTADAAERSNPPTTVGSKTPLTQREIPQSISVVTQAQIQDRNLMDMNDALRKTPGIVVTPYRDGRADLFSRGFPVDTMQLDGLPISLNMTENGLLTPDLAMYDRVETLRGPAGLYNGFGGPGGTVNLVRKRPLDDLAATAEVRVGTDHEYRGMADVSTPLNDAKTLRARVVGSYENTDLYQDSTYKRPGLLYGVVEADLTPSTTLSIGASYQRLTMRSMSEGYPAYTDYRLIQHPSRDYIGSSTDGMRYESNSAFFDLEHKFGSDWRVKLSGTHLYNTASMKGTYACCGGVDRATGLSKISWGGGSSGNNTQDVMDVFVDGPFDLAGRQHHLTVGMNYQRSNNYIRNVYGDLGNYVDVNDPVELPGYSGAPLTSYALRTVTTQYTTYANARFKLADPLTLVLGGNAMWWRASVRPVADQNPFDTPNTRDSVDGRITPYGGLLYDINQTYTAYASYTSIFSPQSARDKDGKLIKPMQGDQYEVGLKGTYLDGKLNTSVALFQLTEKNRAVADPREDPYSGISIAQGKARSRGVEASVSGEAYRGLDLYAGYAYTHVSVADADDDGGSNGLGAQKFTQIAPKHTFKLWANYQLPGEWHRYSVGTGLNVSSSYYYDDGVGRLTQPGYMTADLKLGYQINDHLDASLYVANLFNKSYYESVGSTWNQNFLGAARTAMLTLRWRM